MSRYEIRSEDVGKGLDPTTLAPAIYHKLIEFDFNDLKIKPKHEVREWLDITLKGRYKIISEEKSFYFEFESDKDKEWFIMRWA